VRSKTGLIDAFLATTSREQFLLQADRWPDSLSLPDAGKLTAHLRRLGGLDQELRLAFVHTVTSELLDPWLELHTSLQGFESHIYHAPFGLGPMEAEPGSGLHAHKPDVTTLLLTRNDLHPELANPDGNWNADNRGRLSTDIVERLAGVLARYRNAVDGQLLLCIVPPILSPALGIFDAQFEFSEQAWWSQTKAAIAERMRRDLPATMLLDLDEVQASVGRKNFFDLRFWYTSLYPFAPCAAQELARRIVAVGTVASTPRAKVIVLDADNTLWGGVVGEDGINGISLSPEHPGNAFMDFQRRLLDYQQRGFILALCSKNNEADVAEVLSEHPHQILRDDHFAAQRVNWQPKPDNLRSLAKELNLGLDSFVFVDDSDYECALVRRELPMVRVVQTPAKEVDVPGCLEHLVRLEVLSLTDEDRQKTQMYAAERKRRGLMSDVHSGNTDILSHLRSLEMKMAVRADDSASLKRLSQMTQKTNQFNLTTRRYDEQQIQTFIDDEHCLVTSFSLSDIFGDSGIVGLAIISGLQNGKAELDTFLMSCRVIGRQAESAFLSTTLNLIRERGAQQIVADFLPTRKNQLAENFLPLHGFNEHDGRYHRDLIEQPQDDMLSFPIDIHIEAQHRSKQE
jgi:FkbH-like protein